MAGNYPDPPGKRIMWDKDGSALVYYDGSVITLQSYGTAVNFQDDEASNNGGVGGSTFWAILFPNPMDIVGFNARATASNGSRIIEYSTNTTTGQDGTWSTLSPVNGTATGSAGTDYRLDIVSSAPMPLTGVLGVRIRSISGTGSGGIVNFHLYGSRTSLAGNFLNLWHATIDQPFSAIPAAYDLGDKPRGYGPLVTSFRIKNCSATLQANTITVMREVLTELSPPNLGYLQLRYNAGAYGNTCAVGNLAAGVISAVVDAKVDFASTMSPGRWAPRIIASAASWA